MRVRAAIHRFDVTPREAVALQRELAGRVRARGAAARRLRLVAGVDCALDGAGVLHAAAVLCAAPGWEVVAEASAAGRPGMAYVPGLLSFREAPLVLEALGRLEGEPQAVLVDGQGIAHPRRLGIAAHLGLHLDVPVVGVGKSRLVGEHEEPGPERGDSAPLVHRGERIGSVVRTRARVKPVYVSVGNRISLAAAVRVVLATCTRYRLPEPVRQADLLSRRRARGTRGAEVSRSW